MISPFYFDTLTPSFFLHPIISHHFHLHRLTHTPLSSINMYATQNKYDKTKGLKLHRNTSFHLSQFTHSIYISFKIVKLWLFCSLSLCASPSSLLRPILSVLSLSSFCKYYPDELPRKIWSSGLYHQKHHFNTILMNYHAKFRTPSFKIRWVLAILIFIIFIIPINIIIYLNTS